MKHESVFRIYFFLLLFLLPIDYFAPTAQILKEFGSKPVSIILSLGGFYGIICILLKKKVYSVEIKIIAFFALILCLGGIAFILNHVMGWSSNSYYRKPLNQFMLQGLLVVASGIIIFGNFALFRSRDVVKYFSQYLPIVATIHILVFTLQFVGIFHNDSAFFSLFNLEVYRPVGLCSEPSYFGVTSALYGTALFFLKNQSTNMKRYNFTLAILFYVAAIIIVAKTFALILAFQVIYIVLKKSSQIKHIIGKIFIVLISLLLLSYFILNNKATNVEENLSTAMRFGSTNLALNVSLDGYCLSGIGFGQFHFFYKEEYAPSYLFVSEEAQNQFDKSADSRASTFNFYLRVLLEIGVLGFLLLLYTLKKIWQLSYYINEMCLGIIFSGSLGFLMTQDTYIYPPLLLSITMILSTLHYRSKQNLLLNELL